MKKIIIILTFYLIFLSLLGQDIRLKEKKLINLKDKLKDFEDLIGKNKKKQKKTLSSMKQYSNKKNKTQNLISRYKQKKEGVYDIIQDNIKHIKIKNQQIKDLKNLCNNELLKLFFLEYKNQISNERNFHENELLKLLITQSVTSLDNTIAEHENLQKLKDTNFNKYKKINSSLKKKESQYVYYKNKSNNLSSQLNKLKKKNSVYSEELEKIRKEKEMLTNLIVKLKKESGQKIFNYKFTTSTLPWPVEGKILKEFGKYKIDKVTLINKGIDISGKIGDPVKVVDEGTVVYAKWYTGAGKLVIINHNNGFYSLYSHNDCILVSKGDKVAQGDVIAKLGDTGSTEVPCLHFELRKDGISIDPREYLQ